MIKFQLLFIVLTSIFIPSVSARESTWLYMKVENVEVVADLPEKELLTLSNDIFYFNRAIEFLLPKSKRKKGENIKVLIVSSTGAFREVVSGRKLGLMGTYGGLPSLKVIALRSSHLGEQDEEGTLIWGLTHEKLAPLNQRRWFLEAFASLFKSIELGKEKIKFGSINKGMSSYMKFGRNEYDISLNDVFVSDESWNAIKGNSDILAYHRANSYFLTHYCLLGNQELAKPFLAFCEEPVTDEVHFIKHFGFNFEELNSRLWEYAMKGGKKAFVLNRSSLPQPPTPEIRIATESEWKNTIIRAKFMNKDKSEARALLDEMPQDDPVAVETRGVLAFVRRDQQLLVGLAGKAHNLGVNNRILQVVAVNSRLDDLMRERHSNEDPKLSAVEAKAFIDQIKPSLQYYRKNLRSVSTLIRILDAAEAKVPLNLQPLFVAWENKHSLRYPELKAALDGIRDRSNFPAED
jgi:hypothetical protein